MILSKPDLIQGFRNATDKRNVGVHEFAHLVDKSDGVIDGVPGVGLDRLAVGPWIDLVRRKMAEIEEGRSDIDRYALTNDAEFFAVTSEYFFERPAMMQRKHPHLFDALERIFNQDLRSRAAQIRRALTRPRPRFVRGTLALAKQRNVCAGELHRRIPALSDPPKSARAIEGDVGQIPDIAPCDEVVVCTDPLRHDAEPPP